MNIFASSRAEKTFILKEIISNLKIWAEEKELYFFSMEILENEDFDRFFEKITGEFQKNTIQIL